MINSESSFLPNNINKYHLPVLVIVWLIIHCLLFWHYGVRNRFESAEYLMRADLLLKNKELEDIRHIFYAIPIIIITFFRLISPERIVPYLIFQSILSGFATLVLYKSSTKVFNNKEAGFLSGIIFLIWFDNIQWDLTLMSESLMCSFIIFLIYKLSYFKGTHKDYLWIILLLGMICITRPTGIVIAVGTVAFLLSYHWVNIKDKPMLKYSLVLGLFIVAYLGAYFMFMNWDFTEQLKKGNIVTYVDSIEKTDPLFRENLRMETSNVKFAVESNPPFEKIIYFIVHNPIYFLKSGGLKVWYLLTSSRPYYSYRHNMYTFTWVSLIYILFYFGCRLKIEKPIKIFVLVVILVNCGLISMATIDWDNRFYIPMEPGVVLISGGGCAFLLNLIKLRLQKGYGLDHQTL